MIEEILLLKQYIKIVHHVNGRIRLKAEPEILNEPLFKQINAINEEIINRICTEIPGVIASRVNLMARSLIIRYDPDIISPDRLEELLETANSEKARNIIIQYKNANLDFKEVIDVQ